MVNPTIEKMCTPCAFFKNLCVMRECLTSIRLQVECYTLNRNLTGMCTNTIQTTAEPESMESPTPSAIHYIMTISRKYALLKHVKLTHLLQPNKKHTFTMLSTMRSSASSRTKVTAESECDAEIHMNLDSKSGQLKEKLSRNIC